MHPSLASNVIKNRPCRFDVFYIKDPVFYITCCTLDRRPIRELSAAHDAFSRYGERATQHNVAVGRYMLMPDHLHLFVKGDANFLLSRWMGGLKRAIAVALRCRSRELWQPGFFDHVLRSDESYADKWNYVSENPVRAGLVRDASEWPYQGEIVIIDSV
jgi:putative transposase